MKVFIITKRTLMLILAALLVLIGGVIIFLAFNDGSATVRASADVIEQYELTALTGTQRELPVYSVQRPDKRIALTIDAAWEDDKTPFILETLKKYNVKATFFLCGFWVEKYPDEVKQIFAEGHQLGNHTATHPHMNSLSASQMRKELENFDKLVVELTGEKPTVFRAPYGEYNDLVISTVRDAGYEPIQWDLDTVDTVLMTFRGQRHSL